MTILAANQTVKQPRASCDPKPGADPVYDDRVNSSFGSTPNPTLHARFPLALPPAHSAAERPARWIARSAADRVLSKRPCRRFSIRMRLVRVRLDICRSSRRPSGFAQPPQATAAHKSHRQPRPPFLVALRVIMARRSVLALFVLAGSLASTQTADAQILPLFRRQGQPT